MSQLGERIRSLRKQNNLYQADLAKALDKTSVSISQYEKGSREPDARSLKILATMLHTSTDYLLGMTDDPSDPEDSRTPPSNEGLLAAHIDKDYSKLTSTERKQIEDFIKLVKNQKK